LTAHRPAPDVEYKPGVDVGGRPVAPADLSAPASPAIDQVRVELKRDLPVAAGSLGTSEIVIGEVTVDIGTGKAMLNGRPLDQAVGNDVYLACTRR
jgi:hypothetical protein